MFLTLFNRCSFQLCLKCSLLEMSAKCEKASKWWHEDQQEVFDRLLCMPQYKPIVGDGDGVMARMVEQVWQP
jgi:hypothetical protein